MVIVNIDTSKDTDEDIRKTIAYLESLLAPEEAEPPVASLPAAPPAAPPAADSPVPPPSDPRSDAADFPDSLEIGLEIFNAEAQKASSSRPADAAPTVPSSRPQKRPEAEKLLEEADDVEVVDEAAGAFIEIVDLEER